VSGTWITERGEAEGCQGQAVFSGDRRYRYSLTRSWFGTGGHLVVIGLNPSTATASVNDATIRRCAGFARREGCTRLTMVNLFALVARNPRHLLLDGIAQVTGPGNDEQIMLACFGQGEPRKVVAAWGCRAAHPQLAPRRDRVLAMLAGYGIQLHAFGITRDGEPKHPLYLPSGTPLVPVNLALRARP